VREHGGKIGIRSREGRGTTVTISLPSEAQSKARIESQAAGRSLPEKVR
jgi:signal transduction histidine kinase